MGELFVFIKTELAQVIFLFNDGTFLFFQVSSFWLDWVDFYVSNHSSVKAYYPSYFEVCTKLCKPKFTTIYASFENLELKSIDLNYDFSWFINIRSYYNYPQHIIYIVFL